MRSLRSIFFLPLRWGPTPSAFLRRCRASRLGMAAGAFPLAQGHYPQRPPLRLGRGGSLLDTLLVLFTADDVLDEDARRDDMIRIDLAGLDQMFDLRDRDARGRGHHRIEIARGAP